MADQAPAVPTVGAEIAAGWNAQEEALQASREKSLSSRKNQIEERRKLQEEETVGGGDSGSVY